ncbi:glycoside hydrolase family 25 [Candidatus Saccharibacteria bacterium]|nr:glycoside hydrolase family 25 [Candidatus Saccharibacteria bacterium]
MVKHGFIKFKTIVINLFLIAALIGVGFFGYTLIKERKLFVNEWFIGNALKGVDISSYQGDVNMKSLSNQGVRFAYIKATEGSSHVDERFEANWKNVEQTDIKSGAYHFFSFKSSGEDQAENYISTVGDLKGRLIPAVDVEMHEGDESEAPDKDALVRQLKIFMAVLEDEYKTKPMIYAQKDFYDKYLKEDFSGYPVWARNVYFPVYIEFGGDWTIWQYKDRGELEGYSGDEKYIDLDIMNPNKNLDDLIVKDSRSHDDSEKAAENQN